MINRSTSTGRILLNLGCGMCTPPGWVNVDGSWSASLAKKPRLKSLLRATRLAPAYVTETPWNPDIVVADLRRRLPFADNEADAVYCSHTLEHFHVESGKRFLHEMHRVFKPGGICRILVPDGLEMVKRGILQPLSDTALHSVVPRVTGRAFETINVGVVARPKSLVGRLWHMVNDIHYHKYLYDEASLTALFKWAGFVNVRRHQAFESRIPEVNAIESKSRASDGSLCMEGEKA